jgi:hypothetical protein
VLDVSTLASNNYVRGVFNASSYPSSMTDAAARSHASVSAGAGAGAAQLQTLFTEHFDREGLSYKLVAASGAADRAVFAEAGIATGGVFVRGPWGRGARVRGRAAD